MSSQFSYELDERQIRILMQDSEVGYSEDAWNKFDELASAQAKSSNSITNYIPNINFGISRSIVVPIIFLVLIGGLSAMLFSFVDFKKKESIEKEIPYVANTLNTTKALKITKPAIKYKQAAIIKVDSSTIVKTPIIEAVVSITPAVITPEIKKEESVKVAETKPKEETVSVIEPKKESNHNPVKKKRKVKTEILPTINASLNLNDSGSEPDLELK